MRLSPHSEKNKFKICLWPLCLIILFSAFGCGKKQAPPAAMAPIVKVLPVLQQDAPIIKEWVASTDGLVNATIRPQVTGYLIRQNYKEGELVKKGQLLFEIDPRTFEANVAQAQGDLERAKAGWKTAKQNLVRIEPLAKKNAVSQKDLDDATGNERSARAQVASAKAALQTAKLNLEFTKILSPIDGIAGNATAQIGDLVGPAQNETLTTVSTLDPIKVYIPISEQEYLHAANAQMNSHEIPLTLILADGSIHPEKGKFVSGDRQVDAKTGTILVTTLFPNPQNILRPGQFAKVRAVIKIQKDALLVPQRAVMEMQGSYQIPVVNSDHTIDVRNIKPGERIDSLWIIHEGLHPGEMIVVEGGQKVRPKMKVTPQPFEADAQNKEALSENPAQHP